MHGDQAVNRLARRKRAALLTKKLKDDIILAGKDPIKERRRLARKGSELDQPSAPAVLPAPPEGQDPNR